MKLSFLFAVFCAFCLAASLSSAMLYESQMIFVIDATVFKNDTSVVSSLYATNGTYYDVPYPNGNYAVKIFSDSSLVYKKDIVISFAITGTNITTDTVKTIMRLPFFYNATKISLLRGGNEIFSLNVHEYLCNDNGVCDSDSGESYVNCPEDCEKVIASCGNRICDVNLGENHGNCRNDCVSGAADNYCDAAFDGRCDTDCKANEDNDCKQTAQQNDYGLIVMIILVVAIVAVLAWFVRRGIREVRE